MHLRGALAPGLSSFPPQKYFFRNLYSETPRRNTFTTRSKTFLLTLELLPVFAATPYAYH
jgi:hypothetical protein